MEGLSTSAYKTLKNYWRRRGYRRLNNAVPHQNPNSPDPHPHPNPNPYPYPTQVRKRRPWRVKIVKKIRTWKRIGSPKKWLIRVRDAYVNMMLRLASGSSLGSVGYGGSVGNGYGFGSGPVKEYDEKVIVEIYKSLVMAQGHLVPLPQTAKFSSLNRR